MSFEFLDISNEAIEGLSHGAQLRGRSAGQWHIDDEAP